MLEMEKTYIIFQITISRLPVKANKIYIINIDVCINDA